MSEGLTQSPPLVQMYFTFIQGTRNKLTNCQILLAVLKQPHLIVASSPISEKVIGVDFAASVNPRSAKALAIGAWIYFSAFATPPPIIINAGLITWTKLAKPIPILSPVSSNNWMLLS